MYLSQERDVSRDEGEFLYLTSLSKLIRALPYLSRRDPDIVSNYVNIANRDPDQTLQCSRYAALQ